MDKTYAISTITLPAEFIVQSQSNDDVGMKFIDIITARINRTQDREPDLFAALCPALEPRYSMAEIFNSGIWAPFDELNFFILQYKW
ncbi:MAG TPA: hypothetical protein VL832_24300, partial [Puia sp.]|nr:hypothetical protein [Puia sp.]